MEGQERLCAHCSNIDYSILRLPTRKELADLNNGGAASDCYPFKENDVEYEPGRKYSPHWTFGLQTRIDKEQGCPLCKAICQVLVQHPRIAAAWTLQDRNTAICIAKFDERATLHPPTGVKWDGRRSYPVFGLSLLWLVPSNDEDLTKPGLIPYTLAANKDGHRDSSKFLAVCKGIFQVSDQSNGSPESTTPFNGRPVTKILDFRLARRWLENCSNSHKKCQHSILEADQTLNLFRLINVQDERVVEIKSSKLESFRYAALSYVWGGPQKFCLNKNNLAALQKTGSLRDTPKTIRDAMTIASRLGLTYIWVDALCLIQDDADDKREQLGHMGKIYANAALCIVAASGDSADSGIPGMSSPRRTQVEVPLPGYNMKLLSTLKSFPTKNYTYIDEFIWSKRGWTFQERILSRRSLVFTDSQILWSCGETQQTEEAPPDTSLAKMTFDMLIDSSIPLISGHVAITNYGPVSYWTWLAYDFVQRSFSFPGDAHDALLGALEYFQENHDFSFLWALPRQGFTLNLLWYGEGHRERRSCLTTLPTTSLATRVPFPSWTWLGWELGSVEFGLTKPSGKFIVNVRIYVFKNSPPRLELVDESDQREPEANRELILEASLLKMTECASFHVKVRANRRQRSPHPGMHQRYIVDDNGRELGRFYDEYNIEAAQASQELCDLIMIATAPSPPQAYLEGGNRKVVLLLEISKGEDGICSRLGVAYMFEEFWRLAKRRNELVILN